MGNKVVKPEEVYLVAGALASETRLKIIRLLLISPLNVTEIAEALDMPVSSAISAVLKLEEAGLISTYNSGKKKICSVQYQAVLLNLTDIQKFRSELDDTVYYSIPIGDYCNFEAQPSCGLLGEKKFIGPLDMREAFLDPNHIFAKLIWMRKGFLEYRINRPDVEGKKIKSLSFSFEICSEFPGYNNEFLSEIQISVNGREIGSWISPGDYGGRYGIFTPHWWGLNNTQFGDLVTCCVTGEGSFANSRRISDVKTCDLELARSDTILLRLETKTTGGFNLFGKNFGDYNQDIAVRIDLGDEDEMVEEKENLPLLPNNVNYAEYIMESVKKHTE